MNRRLRIEAGFRQGALAGQRQKVDSLDGHVIEWNPYQINTACWLDAQDPSTMTLTSGKVEQWRDKSGNLHHAQQGSANSQFDYESMDIYMNGYPSIRNNDPTKSKQYSLAGGSFGAKRIYFVANFKTGVDSPMNVHGPIANNQTGGADPHRITGRVGQVSWDTNPGMGGASVFGLMYQNGESVPDPTNAPMPIKLWRAESVALRTQAWRILGAGNNWSTWQGSLGEIIFTDGTEDHQKVEGYLAHKWGLVSELDPDHPYKNNKPTVTL